MAHDGLGDRIGDELTAQQRLAALQTDQQTLWDNIDTLNTDLDTADQTLRQEYRRIGKTVQSLADEQARINALVEQMGNEQAQIRTELTSSCTSWLSSRSSRASTSHRQCRSRGTTVSGQRPVGWYTTASGATSRRSDTAE